MAATSSPDADRCVEYLRSCRLYQGEHSLRGGWGIGAKLNHLLFGFLEAEVLPRSMRAAELGIDPTPLLDVVATVLRMDADGLERSSHGTE